MLKFFSVILAGFKCLRNKLEKSLKWLGFIFFVSEHISLINGGKSLWSGLQRGLTEQIYVITDFLFNITHYRSFFFFLRKCRYGILVQSNYLSEWVKAVWFIWGFELYKSETISGDFLVQSLRSYQLATTNSLCGWDYSGFSAGPAICVCECMAGYTFANCMFPPWSLTMENFPIPE